MHLLRHFLIAQFVKSSISASDQMFMWSENISFRSLLLVHSHLKQKARLLDSQKEINYINIIRRYVYKNIAVS